MTANKLKDELSYWIQIGIADDIVTMPMHRPEYQHIVKALKIANVADEAIPECALEILKNESTKFVLFQSTFWRLLWIGVKRLVGL